MIVENPIILSVDDDDCASLLVSTVFERVGLVQPIRFVRDGVEAIAYLSGEGLYADRTQYPLPTVMLLDLNMPRKNGFEVLAWLRAQPELKRLQVYILSASRQPDDIRRCYNLGANSYLVKPVNLDGLLDQAKCILAWLKLSHISPIGTGPAASLS